jgi:trans-aconitate 2-methyltransferase
MHWNPSQYARFAGARMQPGLDLIARLPELEPRTVVDLGCGSGELTAALAARFLKASVTGVDSSEAMLERACAQFPELRWVSGDIAHWTPNRPADVVFSNAALQWVPDHDALFPRLLQSVAEGGVLAVQMPRNFEAPSHTELRALAAEPRWGGRIHLREAPVATPERYFDLLSPLASSVDLWETEYLHVLEGEDPVLEWVKGTALLPVFAALEGEEREAFVQAYRERLRRAYPRRADGRTLFPFKRLFLLARR